jgi:hypothetical protein
MNIEEISILESMGCTMIDSLILYKTLIVGDAEYSTFDDIMTQIKSIDSDPTQILSRSY